jgi:transcription termination factor Rho
MSDPNGVDRSALESKDREQLHQIASAMGVRGATRMRKADLVEAIVTAATSGNGDADAARPRAPRRRPDADATPAPSAPVVNGATDGSSTASPTLDLPVTPPAGESAREHARDTDTAAPARAPVPAAAEAGGTATAGAAATATDSSAPAATTTTPSTTPAPTHHEEPYERQPFGDANRRRRRRRGRDRERVPGEGGGPQPQHAEPVGEPIDVEGLLEIRDEGYGFLRTGGYLPGPRDVYVSASQVRRFNLRKGDYVKGATRPAANNEKYPALLRVDEINGLSPDDARMRPRFEDLTPLFPDEKLRLETTPINVTGRIIDLLSPIGKGQRGLIVSPPKAGKTTIMKQIVESIEANNPEVHLMVLLVEERPEEVTDMRRHVQRGEVVASTFDRPSDEHTHVAELAIERAKRLAEMGRDVVIILDGITRLARAYNLSAPASGRILSGGVDSGALYPPRKFFGAARNIEEGGSLTILATALVETGSRMDEVIFEEFKGTGNMELRLDRRLAERRIYPSIDVEASSTRHEELLFDRVQLQQVWKLRRVLNALEGGAGLELLMDKIKTTRSNDEFLAEIAKAPVPG